MPRNQPPESKIPGAKAWRYLWTTRISEHVLVEQREGPLEGVSYVIYDRVAARQVDIPDHRVRDLAVNQMLLAGAPLVRSVPGRLPVCPLCHQVLEARGLLLTEREDSEGPRRVCKALWECREGHGRFWVWADRSVDDLAPWHEDWWPG